MQQDPIATGKRKSVNMSIDTGIVTAAKDVGVNLSRVTEAALRVAIKAERERRWKDDNRQWIEAQNRWIDENGIPLSGLEPL